jgi:hypothetical protein
VHSIDLELVERPRQRLGGDQPLDLGDLGVEGLDLAHGRVDGLALSERQLLLSQPGPALDAEQIRRRRAVLQTAHQDGVNLVLGARPNTHEL